MNAEGAAQTTSAARAAGQTSAVDGDATTCSREHAEHAEEQAHAEEQQSSNGHGAGEAGTEGILFRLAPPEGRLRPGAAAYGAPYDMADLSDGGAIADMLRKLQVEQHGEA